MENSAVLTLVDKGGILQSTGQKGKRPIALTVFKEKKEKNQLFSRSLAREIRILQERRRRNHLLVTHSNIIDL